jgi:hypothetical protein
VTGGGAAGRLAAGTGRTRHGAGPPPEGGPDPKGAKPCQRPRVSSPITGALPPPPTPRAERGRPGRGTRCGRTATASTSSTISWRRRGSSCSCPPPRLPPDPHRRQWDPYDRSSRMTFPRWSACTPPYLARCRPTLWRRYRGDRIRQSCHVPDSAQPRREPLPERVSAPSAPLFYPLKPPKSATSKSAEAGRADPTRDRGMTQLECCQPRAFVWSAPGICGASPDYDRHVPKPRMLG